mmetsp:Transcript_11321/g.26833  ORF Transcript_11321/g.26833 Transcript_11321/m.26833 type:complete len:207 (-) Transcript_11321:1578-2198(-)
MVSQFCCSSVRKRLRPSCLAFMSLNLSMVTPTNRLSTKNAHTTRKSTTTTQIQSWLSRIGCLSIPVASTASYMMSGHISSVAISNSVIRLLSTLSKFASLFTHSWYRTGYSLSLCSLAGSAFSLLLIRLTGNVSLISSWCLLLTMNQSGSASGSSVIRWNPTPLLVSLLRAWHHSRLMERDPPPPVMYLGSNRMPANVASQLSSSQ